ncbi:hypothetical protein LB467_05285 [Salegentibacter sp. JZCK2]|nr:hypothetical protein [Salegentibacter tibetensis]
MEVVIKMTLYYLHEEV